MTGWRKPGPLIPPCKEEWRTWERLQLSWDTALGLGCISQSPQYSPKARAGGHPLSVLLVHPLMLFTTYFLLLTH